MTGISIIICCYNSTARLPATLRHLAAQASGPVAWEVVVVDNNSADATAEVARKEWQQLGAPVELIVVSERRPGLSMAREAGLAQARYDLVLFCDDDNWLAADYLSQAHELMRQDPAIGILGGLNTAVADEPLPAWFQQFDYAYACGPQAEQDGEVSSQRLYVTGAGMVVRRRIFAELARVGFESQLLDRRGEELSSGGDTELCFATALLGYKLVYSSKLRLSHYMEAKRLTWDYLLKLKKGHAQSYYLLDYYKKLFHHESIRQSWSALALHGMRTLLSRTGVSTFYQYYVGAARHEGNLSSVNALFYYETVKTHFRLRKRYPRFLRYITTLNKNILAYRAIPAEK